MKTTISLVRGLARCINQEVDWNNPEEVITKHDWSPSLFKTGHRNNKNFLECSTLVFDIDSGLTIEQAHTQLGDWYHIIAPTRSHTEEAPRFRVIIPASNKITSGSEHTKALRIFGNRYLPQYDQKCLDPARFYYPSKSVAIKHPGKLYTHTEIMYPVEVAEFLLNTPPEGSGFNSALHIAAKELFRIKKSREEVKEILKRALANNGWSEYSPADESTIESAYRSINQEAEDQEAALPHWLRFLKKSELVVNLSDDADHFVYNKEDHTINHITKQNILREMGKQDGTQFLKTARTVIYQYEPFTHKVFFTNDDGHPAFNLYEPPSWLFEHFHNRAQIPQSAIPTIYQELFSHLMDQPSYEYLLDWIANGLRRKNQTYLCAIAAPGTGKNTLASIIAAVFGTKNQVNVPDQVLKTHFNAALKDRQFIFIDEIFIKEGEQTDRLKGLVNNTITIEEKGKDTQNVKNYASVFLASNKYDGIRLESGDRRFSVVNFTDVPLHKNDKLFALVEMGEHLRADYINQLGQYLWHRKVTHSMYKPFISVKTAQIIEANLKGWERIILRVAKANPGQHKSLDALQLMIELETRHGAPGETKIRDLCKKYPDLLTYKDEHIHFAGVNNLPEV